MPKENDEEQKPKFRVIDKRGGEDPETDDQPAPKLVLERKPAEVPVVIGDADVQAEDFGKVEMSEEEREKLKAEAAEGLKFKNTVIFLVRTLSEQVWIHLGLVPNPITNLSVKDLDEARKSIDLIEVIIGHSESEFDDKSKVDLTALLADLRINYTNQLG